MVALAGCSSFGDAFTPKTSVQLFTTNIYPDFPNIDIPSTINILPFEWEIARDTSTVVIRNTRVCNEVPETERNSSFWKRCGTFEPLPDVNIWLGLDRPNYDNLITDLERLREQNHLLRQRLERVNEQRQEWRDLNDQNSQQIAPE